MTSHWRGSDNCVSARCIGIALALLASFLGGNLRAKAQNPQFIFAPGAAAATPILQPRQFSAVAHDSVHAQFLLFGGTYGSQRFDDTWLLTSAGWTLLNPSTHPSARISSAAAYDSLHNQFVLFGGRIQQSLPAACTPGSVPANLKNEFFCADTWVFAGGNWVQESPAVAPSPREGHAMAFDAMRNQVVLFGGTEGNNATPLNDTWLWDGTTWKQVFPAHNPPARFWHTLAYDPVHRVVVLFGGDGGSQFRNDTWLWDGQDWHLAYPILTPAIRTNAAMDFDPTTVKMVLFSGTTWNATRIGAPALDTWSWNGSQWSQLPAANFQLISDFSTLTPAEAAAATLADGTPSLLWLPVK